MSDKNKHLLITVLSVTLFSTSILADIEITEKNNNIFNSQVGAWYNIWMNPEKSNLPGKEAEDWSFSRYKAKYYEGDKEKNGFYDNGEGEVIKYQKEQIKFSGIDFLLIDWAPNYAAGNSELVAIKVFEQHDAKIAFALGGPLFKGGDADEMKAQADKVYKNFYEIYREKYFSINVAGKSKPLLVVYHAYDNKNKPIPAPYWKHESFHIGRATGRVESDDVTLDQYAWDKCNGGWWGWMQENQRVGSQVMIVSPGADTKKSDKLSGQLIPRLIPRDSWNATPQSGEILTYIKQWIGAIKNNPQFIMIVSWNDYNEKTHIEPSTPFYSSNRLLKSGSREGESWKDETGQHDPFLYVKITRAYSALRTKTPNKPRLLEGYYYRDQSSPAVSRVVGGKLIHVERMSEIEKGHPIIELPDNWLTQIKNNMADNKGATFVNSYIGVCNK